MKERTRMGHCERKRERVKEKEREKKRKKEDQDAKGKKQRRCFIYSFCVGWKWKELSGVKWEWHTTIVDDEWEVVCDDEHARVCVCMCEREREREHVRVNEECKGLFVNANAWWQKYFHLLSFRVLSCCSNYDLEKICLFECKEK